MNELTHFADVLNEFTTKSPGKSGDIAVIQCIRHLKILRSYKVLKERILVGLTHPQYTEKLWTAFITIAARRFNLWVNSLYNKFGKNSSGMGDFISGCLPPLDVIMVWHSLLLNPKSCQDVFKYLNFESFLNIPLPLNQIDLLITNTTFIYQQSPLYIDKFYHFMLTNSDATMGDITYDCYAPFDPSTIKLPIFCPKCNHKLGTADLIGAKGFGYAESLFQFVSWTNCKCGFDRLLNHLELIKRLLFHDVNQFQQIPGIYKHFSPNINKISVFEGVNQFDIDHGIKFVIMTNQDLLKLSSYASFLSAVNDKLKPREKVILTEYLQMKCISSTIAGGLTIRIDLVDCVLRHGVFIDKIEEMKWIESPELFGSLKCAFDRYIKFIDIVSTISTPIPTLDIDLLWHTHQLHHKAYHDFCRSYGGKLIDHPDRIPNFKLISGFEITCVKWYQKYNQPYTFCLCDICSINRDAYHQTSCSSSSPLYFPLVQDEHKFNITHISDHNSCAIPYQGLNNSREKWHQYQDVDTPLSVEVWNEATANIYHD